METRRIVNGINETLVKSTLLMGLEKKSQTDRPTNIDAGHRKDTDVIRYKIDLLGPTNPCSHSDILN